MSSTQYCYHCGIHHHEDVMRRFPTKAGMRMRCIKSIEAAKQSLKVREAFGRKVTDNNKVEARNKAKWQLNPEMFYRALSK